MNRITRATMPLQAVPTPPVRAAHDGCCVGLCETANLTFKCSPTTGVFYFLLYGFKMCFLHSV